MYPIRRRTSSGRVSTSKPATRASPALAASSPVSILIAVVLPAPLAPRKPNTSPAATSKLIASTAVKVPKRRVRPRTSIAELTPPPEVLPSAP
jgi:hypothetical protein